MEPLSNILKILYTYNSEGILNDALTGIKSVHHDKEVDENTLIHLLVNRHVAGSLDQAAILAETLKAKWMMPAEEFHMLHFLHYPSVFNTLLYFSAYRLHLSNNMPICNHDNLLAWNDLTEFLGEDLLVTSYLASRDIAESRTRNNFSWETCLNSDARDLNYTMQHTVCDVHSHLKGSSANFELSWICLMNRIAHRSKDFKKLQNKKLTAEIEISHRLYNDTIYIKVIKAAAIRLLLYKCVVSKDCLSYKHKHDIEEILSSHSELDVVSKLDRLQAYIDCEKMSSPVGMKYSKLDYSIKYSHGTVNDVLSGERYFLYQIFRSIYEGGLNSKDASLFYAYLVIKEELRKEIIQVNSNVGFRNFAEYEERKTIFIPDGSVYYHLLLQLAISNYVEYKSDKRYVEPRITPKTSVCEIIKSLKDYDNAIRYKKYTKDRTENWTYHYIFHFIKIGDNSDNNPLITSLTPRHARLREVVRKQTLAIYNFRNSGSKICDRLVGIDAANSEILCRPEVFAMSFRCLRSHPIDASVIKAIPNDLGRTYHVGEDFYSIVDGLRAVDEVVKFLHFNNGDRIGHGLVLGTDVNEYYHKRSYCVNGTLQVLLDDIAWLYINVQRLTPSSVVLEYLRELFEKNFRLLYKGFSLPSIYTYYQSWLLRGDNPYMYQGLGKDVVREIKVKEEKSNLSISTWERCSFNYGMDFVSARKNPDAIKLYSEYHFNSKVKNDGYKSQVLKIPREVREDLMAAIEKVQERMLSEIEKKHLAIECNPTSNLKIGDLTRYEEHPIFKFNNYGLNTPYKCHNISVSINTDDKGVFSTSLEREYELIGIALEKTKNEKMMNAPRAIIDWLDRVRQMSNEQKFAQNDIDNIKRLNNDKNED